MNPWLIGTTALIALSFLMGEENGFDYAGARSGALRTEPATVASTKHKMTQDEINRAIAYLYNQ